MKLQRVLNFLLLSLGLCAASMALAEPKPSKPNPPKTEIATFAAGCFWGTEEFFRKVPGVVKTRVGYTGGKALKPKYEDVSEGRTGHAEALEFEFDPQKISYEKLLEMFFKFHDPTTLNRQGNDVGLHYRSAIFFHNAQQRKAALDFIKKVDDSKAWKKPIVTKVRAAKIFWEAEEEHQKYLVKNPDGYDNHYLRNISFDKKN